MTLQERIERLQALSLELDAQATWFKGTRAGTEFPVLAAELPASTQSHALLELGAHVCRELQTLLIATGEG